MNSIGMYSEEITKFNPTERDALYSMLVPRTTTSLKELNHNHNTLTSNTNTDNNNTNTNNSKTESKALLDIIRKDKIDLVNELRPRYVAKDLLPSLRVLSGMFI